MYQRTVPLNLRLFSPLDNLSLLVDFDLFPAAALLRCSNPSNWLTGQQLSFRRTSRPREKFALYRFVNPPHFFVVELLVGVVQLQVSSGP